MKLFPVWGRFSGFEASPRSLKGRAGGRKAARLGCSKEPEQTAAACLPSAWWLKSLRAAEPVFCSVHGALILPWGGNHVYLHADVFACIWLVHPYSEETLPVLCWGGNLEEVSWAVSRKNASSSTGVTRSLDMLDTPSVSLLQSEVPSEGPLQIPAGKRATAQTAAASAVRCSLRARIRACLRAALSTRKRVNEPLPEWQVPTFIKK